jgi:hypothetical protein
MPSDPSVVCRLDNELVTALQRVGLYPAALAAAAVGSNLVPGVVDGVGDYLAAHPSILSNADDACASARATCSRYARLLESGLAPPQTTEDLGSANAALAVAEAHLSATLESLFESGTAGLPPSAIGLLGVVRDNAVRWTAPTEFLAVERTETDWKRLLQALGAERHSQITGEPLEEDDADFLTSCRTDSVVAAAKASLDAGLIGVDAAWEESVASR